MGIGFIAGYPIQLVFEKESNMAVVISPHKRRDLGVLVRWEISMNNNIFITEQLRGYFKCASCASRICNHSRIAEQLEQNWQIENQCKLGSCFFCGRLAPDRNGLAICARCIS